MVAHRIGTCILQPSGRPRASLIGVIVDGGHMFPEHPFTRNLKNPGFWYRNTRPYTKFLCKISLNKRQVSTPPKAGTLLLFPGLVIAELMQLLLQIVPTLDNSIQ